MQMPDEWNRLYKLYSEHVEDSYAQDRHAKQMIHILLMMKDMAEVLKECEKDVEKRVMPSLAKLYVINQKFEEWK